ncbi:hypothetical protein [Candidatus Palauibacter sp.]|uniref:hypothetical protein n=1 Tax=Candidatus Palauibacter sp. TaxID=3101350 RepID=UPI003B51B4EB
MEAAAEKRLRLLNADYREVAGRGPQTFYCPILYRDEEAELCRAHIVNESFPESDRKWTIQRADVDSWFGSMFEADFVKLKYREKLKVLDVLADPELTRQLRPKFTLDGEEVEHYAVTGPVPDRFSPVLVDHESEPIELVLKVPPEELLKGERKQWDVAFEQDLRLPALVSLLKSAHLTLFHLVGYRYALSAGGRFLGRKVLGDFFDRTVELSRSDALLEARNHFKEFRNLVRPIVPPTTDLAGTVTDGLFHLCRYSGGWAKAVFVRTGEHLHTVLVPVLDNGETAARFMAFLDQSSVTFEARPARYMGDHWEVSPTSWEFEWPRANFERT